MKIKKPILIIEKAAIIDTPEKFMKVLYAWEKDEKSETESEKKEKVRE